MDNTNIPKTTPKDVFLHLFAIVTFYLTVISFITLYIQYINALFPDALNFYYNGISQGVRWATSILVVALPAYLISNWLLNKDVKVEPLHREIKIRRWLVYLTLFVSAVTVIIDLMVLVYNFLNGELSTRFFLKIIVVLLVAAAVFAYYFWELKSKELNSNLSKILASIVIAVVLASIVWGFFIVGSPKDQRNRRFDEQRVQALRDIQYQVLDYWQNKNILPTDLSALTDSISGFKASVDPETAKTYEYKVIGALTFELCADFKTDSKDNVDRNGSEIMPIYNMGWSDNWEHKAERTCFERTIDAELYKLPGKEIVQ